MAINSEHRALPGDALECFSQAGTSRFDPQPDPLARCGVMPSVTDLRAYRFSGARRSQTKTTGETHSRQWGECVSIVLFCGCEEVQSRGTRKFRASGHNAVIGIVTLGRSCTCNKPPGSPRESRCRWQMHAARRPRTQTSDPPGHSSHATRAGQRTRSGSRTHRSQRPDSPSLDLPTDAHSHTEVRGIQSPTAMSYLQERRAHVLV